ncbi:putative monovalent cation/H+ antiporter subunit D [Anaplasma centrale str. Israel]|uniref:Putative monovalent cation/H+ antiporter subunit D n=1 Tax=Anaplasma centrale (strain Israel) TaxID=574556 RepID=D1AU90_ANACI|nr:proton-conducting transporter membrane subunit [Anaplasma centrale]ACZ49118.1 putative monovalent cation/H+ antiporter subunit D [Anaplasma centrale str. Israel]
MYGVLSAAGVYGFFAGGANAALPVLWRDGLELSRVLHSAMPLFLSFSLALLAILLQSCGNMRAREVLCCLLYYASSTFVLSLSDPTFIAVGFEFMALFALLLIAYGCPAGNIGAFLHYASVHFISGVLLLVGACKFAQVGQFTGLSKTLYMAGLLINAASFPASSWVSHTYPMSSRFGIMVLSAFTTKVAACILLRMFSGDPILLYAGMMTAIYGAIFAWLERNIRKAMSYNVVGQVGLMLIAIGFSGVSYGVLIAYMALSVLYQTLLFMVADVVTVGSAEHRRGGLYAVYLSMFACIVAVLNMGAFPGSAGFVVKSLVLHSTGTAGLIDVISKQVFLICSLLLFAGVGLRLVWLSSVQLRASHNESSSVGRYLLEAPMAFLVLLLVVLGMFHKQVLSFTGERFVYTPKDVAVQIAAISVTALCFVISLRNKLLGRCEFSIDIDWIYRRFLPKVISGFWNFVLYLCNVLSEKVCIPEYDDEDHAWVSALRQRMEAADVALLLCMLVIGVVLVLTYV